MATSPLDQIAADVHECKSILLEALNGNPGAGQPGIWIRIDRLERFVATALFLASTAFVAAIGAVVSAFTTYTGHK
jgi:hypothetical protein